MVKKNDIPDYRCCLNCDRLVYPEWDKKREFPSCIDIGSRDSSFDIDYDLSAPVEGNPYYLPDGSGDCFWIEKKQKEIP